MRFGTVSRLGAMRDALRLTSPQPAATPCLLRQYHVGMGADPGGLVSFCQANNIVVQAYSALGGGTILRCAREQR